MNPSAPRWRLRGPYGDLDLVRRVDVRSGESASQEATEVVIGAIDDWLSNASARRTLVEMFEAVGGMLASDGRRVAEGMLDRAIKQQIERALRSGRIIALRLREPQWLPHVETTPPTPLRREEDVEASFDWIQVMLFDSAGNPMPSALEPADEPRFDVALLNGTRMKDNPIANGFGRVAAIDPGGPSACDLTFPKMAKRPYAPMDEAPPVAAPKIDQGLVRGPLLGPLLVTRKDLANAHPGSLNATTVFQLRRRRAEVIECEHFNEGGSVFLPGPSPALMRENAERVQGIDVLKACLARCQGVAETRILIAGHHATVSKQMAKSVTYLLTAQRDEWVELASANGTPDDSAAILLWVAATKGWACGVDSGDPTLAFQRAYNAEIGRPVGTPIAEDGVVTAKTWGAFFDMYMQALRPPGLAAETPPALYPLGDDATRSGRNAGRPVGQYPFVLLGFNGPGNAPITIAKYGAGSETHYMELQPLNPQYRIGEEAEWVGQTLNVPWEWAPKLVAAGYTIEQDPVPAPPPVAPSKPGPDPLPKDLGPKWLGMGANFLVMPYSKDKHRRAVVRHVDVLVLEEDVIGEWSDLYDPREVLLHTRPLRGAQLSVRVVEMGTDIPVPNATVRVVRAGVDVAKQETDDAGITDFTELAPGLIDVVARQDGFETTRMSIEITQGDHVETIPLEEKRLRLYDSEHKYMAGARCKVLVGGAVALDTHSDAAGYVSVRRLGAASQCTVMWGPADAPPGAFDSRVDIYLETSAAENDDVSRERLNNLGYPARRPLAENVRSFQRDYAARHGLTVSGQLDEATVRAIRTVHAQCADHIRSS